MRTGRELVSCIIPVVRNDPHVKECVKSILDSTYKNIEIIVVDEGQERSAQRNIGIDRANGEYLAFFDSDMRAHPKLLEDCLDKVQEHIAVYIPERIVTEGWFARLRDWERQFYNGSLVDVVRFVRADYCSKFDETLHGPEDSDWQRQIIKRCWENAGAIKGKLFSTSDYPFYHHDKVGLIKWLKKKAYYAQSLSKYKKNNPDDKLLTFKYRCFDVFVHDGKWRKLAARPHMAFGVALLLLARGLIYWHRTLFYK